MPPYLKQAASLHGPDVDLEGIPRPGTHDVSTRINRQAGELAGSGRCESAEVAIPANNNNFFFLRFIVSFALQCYFWCPYHKSSNKIIKEMINIKITQP